MLLKIEREEVKNNFLGRDFIMSNWYVVQILNNGSGAVFCVASYKEATLLETEINGTLDNFCLGIFISENFANKAIELYQVKTCGISQFDDMG